jgi:DNA topoisomerase IA
MSSSYAAWNFQRKQDNTFSVSTDEDEGRPVPASSEAELVRQMNANGIGDEWRKSVLTQLAKGNTARVVVPRMGQFSQAYTRP